MMAGQVRLYIICIYPTSNHNFLQSDENSLKTTAYARSGGDWLMETRKKLVQMTA